MIRVAILSVGKTKEKWLEEAISMYVERLGSVCQFEFLWYKDDQQFLKACSEHKDLILLDPEGKLLTSEEFTERFFQEAVKSHSRLHFAIGGADGFSQEMKKRYPRISLSPMTFTHQMTRLLLVEQIFRAFEIQKGSGYHK